MLVCVSQAVRANMVAHVPRIHQRTEVVHNGIAPIVSHPRVLGAKVRFFLFGRLMPKKGQWFLLEAINMLSETERAACEFVLMGGTVRGQEALKTQLEHKILEHDLADTVFIRDFAEDIAQPMAAADVCLVPSMMRDPFPTTVLEAMSVGKPVIATNHGGAREAIIDGESGLLVAPGDVKALANQIRKVVRDPALRQQLGAQAQQRYQTYFTEPQFAKRWCAALSRIIEGVALESDSQDDKNGSDLGSEVWGECA